MAKGLTQITFDFAFNEEAANTAGRAVASTKKSAEQKKGTDGQPQSAAGTSVQKRPGPNPPKSTRGRRSLKENGAKVDLIQVPADEVLFQKQYYSIGDVAKMFRENQSLIRYWETEFDILKPKKNKKGDRFFRPVDIKNLVLIYDLLRRRKLTIEGAKEYLQRNKLADEKFAAIQSLEKIKAFLLELKATL